MSCHEGLAQIRPETGEPDNMARQLENFLALVISMITAYSLLSQPWTLEILLLTLIGGDGLLLTPHLLGL